MTKLLKILADIKKEMLKKLTSILIFVLILWPFQGQSYPYSQIQVNWSWYPTVSSWGFYLSPLGYSGYFPRYHFREPIYPPVVQYKTNTFPQLVALGEAKKETWLIMKNQVQFPSPVQSFPPLEAPKIILNQPQE